MYLLDTPTAVIMTIHWLPLVEKEILTADSLSVSLSVSETITNNDCVRDESRALSVSALRSFRHQSVRSFATKLLNFASFSHSLRNIVQHTVQILAKHNVYPIAYNTGEKPDESTRERRVLRCRSPARPKHRIYVERSHWLFELRCAKWASQEADCCRAFVRVESF